MIVYCAGPVKGDQTYHKFHLEIIALVSTLGHTALSELNSEFKSAFPLNDHEVFNRDIKWMDRSKIVIAEASGSSLGVGFEICYALYIKKIPVLVLVNSAASLSSMIMGCNSELLTIKKYADDKDLESIISTFIKKSNDN
jgi:hypothetical protein